MEYHKHSLLLNFDLEAKNIHKYVQENQLAIDVGGNHGLWTYALLKSSMFKEILVYEPNAALTNNLEFANYSNVTIVHKALSNKTDRKILRIPIQGNMMLTGWASLENKIDVETKIFQELVVETIRLDDMNLTKVGFIKIDVEGHELDLLEGARDFFTLNRPVCVIECRDRNRKQMEVYFESLKVGYKIINTPEIYGFKMSPGNFLFSTS